MSLFGTLYDDMLAKHRGNLCPSDLHRAQSSHLSSGGAGGGRGGGRAAEQHARVWHHPADLHGHGGVRRRQVRQQAGAGVSGLCHSLHPGRLRRRHQDRRRPSHIPVSRDDRRCHVGGQEVGFY